MCMCVCPVFCAGFGFCHADGKVKEMRRAVHKLVKASGGSPEEVLKNTVDGKRRSAMHFAANFGKLETVQLAYAINKEYVPPPPPPLATTATNLLTKF